MLAYKIKATKKEFSEMLKATLFLLEEAWRIFQVDSMQIRLSTDTCKGTSLPAQEVCSERAAVDVVKSSSWKGREAARATPSWAAEGKETEHVGKPHHGGIRQMVAGRGGDS